MDVLPQEVQYLIINQIFTKCYCLNVCKQWEKMIKDNKPNNDLITHIISRDYYAIQYNCFNCKIITREVINVAIFMNDSLIFKIILKTIYTKILPESDSVIMYFKADNYDRTIIDSIVNHIIIKGNYKALKHFTKIHYNSGFPYDLTYMSNISNIIYHIHKLEDHKFGHFKMINNLMKDPGIEWSDDDIESTIQILASSFDKFYNEMKNDKNIKFIILINKLINPNKKKVKKVKQQKIPDKCNRTIKYKYTVQERNIINDKKAYLECIRHGLHNITDGIPMIKSNDIIKFSDDSELTFLLLSLSGNCDLKDIILLYHIEYHIDYNKEIIEDIIDKLDMNERYNELISRLKK